MMSHDMRKAPAPRDRRFFLTLTKKLFCDTFREGKSIDLGPADVRDWA